MCLAGPAEASTPRIVGGQGVSISDVPWQALIIAGGKFCGGSIINESWVLTAAHCLYGIGPTQVSVFTGISNYSQNRSTPSTPVANVIVHPGYNPAGFANDIAMIQLTTPLTLGPTTGIIALPGGQDPGSWPAVNTEALVSGWGATAYQGSLSDQLLRATVQVLGPPTAPCGQYSAGSFDGTMSVCAGLPSGGVDTCQGDSGGPLVVLVAGVPLLAGVTSDGVECARAEYPGIYTRTTTYIPWIRGYAKIPIALPTPPNGVTVTALAGEKLLVSWAPSVTTDDSLVSTYTVTSTLVGSAEMTAGPTCTTATTTCVLEGASTGGAYSVVVTASNPLGQGAPSIAPAPVISVTGTSTTGRVVKTKTLLKWAGLPLTLKAKLRVITPGKCTLINGGARMNRVGVCKVAVSSIGRPAKSGAAIIGVGLS